MADDIPVFRSVPNMLGQILFGLVSEFVVDGLIVASVVWVLSAVGAAIIASTWRMGPETTFWIGAAGGSLGAAYRVWAIVQAIIEDQRKRKMEEDL